MKKIETLAEYQQLASRTCVDLGTPKANAFHMNLGILTEIGEVIDPIKKYFAYNKPLDKVNIGEEIADTMWYIANGSRMFLSAEKVSKVWSTNQSLDYAIKDFKLKFNKEISQANNENQKLVMVSKLLHSIVTFIPDLETIREEDWYGIVRVSALYIICELINIDFWQILTNNIEKLQIRYPEKFTEEAALNRDLDAERKILEKQ